MEAAAPPAPPPTAVELAAASGRGADRAALCNGESAASPLPMPLQRRPGTRPLGPPAPPSVEFAFLKADYYCRTRSQEFTCGHLPLAALRAATPPPLPPHLSLSFDGRLPSSFSLSLEDCFCLSSSASLLVSAQMLYASRQQAVVGPPGTDHQPDKYADRRKKRWFEEWKNLGTLHARTLSLSLHRLLSCLLASILVCAQFSVSLSLFLSDHMTETEAKQRYVDLLTNFFPDWEQTEDIPRPSPERLRTSLCATLSLSTSLSLSHSLRSPPHVRLSPPPALLASTSEPRHSRHPTFRETL